MSVQIGNLEIMALTPDTTVQEIADPAIVLTSQTVAVAQSNIATAASTNAVAQTNIATAQSGIKTAAETLATEMVKANLEDSLPSKDHDVWLAAAVARATHPDRVVSSHPEVAVFADKVLLAYKQRFPRE